MEKFSGRQPGQIHALVPNGQIARRPVNLRGTSPHCARYWSAAKGRASDGPDCLRNSTSLAFWAENSPPARETGAAAWVATAQQRQLLGPGGGMTFRDLSVQKKQGCPARIAVFRCDFHRVASHHLVAKFGVRFYGAVGWRANQFWGLQQIPIVSIRP